VTSRVGNSARSSCERFAPQVYRRDKHGWVLNSSSFFRFKLVCLFRFVCLFKLFCLCKLVCLILLEFTGPPECLAEFSYHRKISAFHPYFSPTRVAAAFLVFCKNIKYIFF